MLRIGAFCVVDSYRTDFSVEWNECNRTAVQRLLSTICIGKLKKKCVIEKKRARNRSRGNSNKEKRANGANEMNKNPRNIHINLNRF